MAHHFGQTVVLASRQAAWHQQLGLVVVALVVLLKAAFYW
jgi:hypothetical protein